MATRLEATFSYLANGTVWNTLFVPKRGLLFLEIRNEEKKEVTFSAIDLTTDKAVVEALKFEEPWWINLAGVTGDILLFTAYTETANPDKKSLVAYDLGKAEVVWWQNDFSLLAVSEGQVQGFSLKFGLKTLVLEALTGKVLEQAIIESPLQNFQVVKPFHYQEGSEAFKTVKIFLERRLGIDPTGGMDYLEHEDLIFISCYVQENGLANFLIVITTAGEILMREKTGESLKGIGMDTFFLLEGSLFFVKNKRELVRYKVIV